LSSSVPHWSSKRTEWQARRRREFSKLCHFRREGKRGSYLLSGEQLLGIEADMRVDDVECTFSTIMLTSEFYKGKEVFRGGVTNVKGRESHTVNKARVLAKAETVSYLVSSGGLFILILRFMLFFLFLLLGEGGGKMSKWYGGERKY